VQITSLKVLKDGLSQRLIEESWGVMPGPKSSHTGPYRDMTNEKATKIGTIWLPSTDNLLYLVDFLVEAGGVEP
jgi:hypothetical protein